MIIELVMMLATSTLPVLLGSVEGAQQCTDHIIDVVIIGAGMAGIAAAQEIDRANNTISYVVIEGQSYIGGRMRSRQFGSIVVEEGANWIVGTSSTSNSPLYSLAQKYGLESVVQDWDDLVTYENGELISDDDIRWDDFAAAYSCLEENAEMRDIGRSRVIL